MAMIKELSDISWQVSEKEYRADSALMKGKENLIRFLLFLTGKRVVHYN